MHFDKRYNNNAKTIIVKYGLIVLSSANVLKPVRRETAPIPATSIINNKIFIINAVQPNASKAFQLRL